MNLYAYVEGDPVNAIDPWGLKMTKSDILDAIITGVKDLSNPDPMATAKNLLKNGCGIQYAKDLLECKEKGDCSNNGGMSIPVCELAAKLRYDACLEEYEYWQLFIDIADEIEHGT